MIGVSQAKRGRNRIPGWANGVCKDSKSEEGGALEGSVVGKRPVWLNIREQGETGINMRQA